MSVLTGIVDRRCKRTCDRFSLFDQKLAVEKLTGLTLLTESVGAALTLDLNKTNDDNACSNYVSSQDKFICQICDVDLMDMLSMREHFKGDWHLYNVQRALVNKIAVTYDQFEDLLRSRANDTDLPMLSDHDASCWEQEEREEFVLPSISTSSHKQMVYFRNKCGEIIGLHRCILFTSKRVPTTMDQLLSCVARARQSKRWAILLYSGGKFAGGVFDGPNELVHKTLHRYTVRAQQGGGQGSFDASNSTMGAARSAGATLRRHGEMAIQNDISDLLHNRWRRFLQACQLILVWSPKVHRSIFFNPPSVYLDPKLLVESRISDLDDLAADPQAAAACEAKLGMTADDARVHRVPCRTKRITFAQVKELHRELSTFDVYDSDANLDFLVQSKRTQLRNLDQSGDNTLLETRSGRLIYGPVRASYGKPPVSPPSCLSPVKHLDESDRLTDTLIQPSDSDTGDEPDDRGNHPPRNRVSVKPPGTGDQKQGDDSSVTAANFERAELEKLYAAHRDWHRRLRVAVAAGDCVHLRNLLPLASSIPHGSDESAAGRIVSDSPSAANPTSPSTHSPNGDLPPNPEACTRLLNHPLAEGRTLLHIAVELQSDPNVIYTLLDSGCDPTLRDISGFTPYKLAAGLRKKALTMVFRRFRFIHPDRYDYEKAEIPAPLDPNKEAEKLERDRERQRRQRQRLKERKTAERALQEKLREEEAERQRFLALSDREKHALVAERRLLANKAAAGELPQVFVRCFQCACDISGKVPFTYMDYRFCSPGCLKTHRLSSTSCKPNA